MTAINPENPEASQEKDELLFAQLVLGFQAAAYQQMGKVMNPFTNKIERNLEMARHSIDMLAMIQAKSASNLTESEAGFLAHVLTELRLNYIEEVNKPQPPADDAKKDSSEGDNQPK
jgi:hypothetical protein